MMTPIRWRNALPTSLVMLMGVVSACGVPDRALTGPARNRPEFWVGTNFEQGAIQICTYGPAGTYGFFVEAGTGSSGSYPLGQNFTLQADECAIVWQTTPDYLTGFAVRVTETAAAAGTVFDSVVGYTSESSLTQNSGQVSFIAPTMLFNFRINADHSGSAQFFHSIPNPNPDAKFITVCKNGPAGTYNFTATATGPNPGTLLQGTSFTVDAGECKQIWQSAPPLSIPDPANTVTVTEVNTNPLIQFDSVVVDTLTPGRGPVSVSGATVTWTVNAFHSGFATFYNSKVPAPPCAGLTPGFWKNWRNHYTAAQFLQLLPGTIASTIQQADAIFNNYPKTSSDPLTKLKWFVLANQLTLNLTTLNAAGANLPNPSAGNLIGTCTGTTGGSQLGGALTIALQIIANPSAYTSAYILSIKDILDAIANLGGG